MGINKPHRTLLDRPHRSKSAFDWRPWFAWRPVKLLYEINESPGYSYVDSGNWAWLYWIERRLQRQIIPDGRYIYWHEHREPPTP